MRIRLTSCLYVAITALLLHTHAAEGCFLGFIGSDCHETTSSSASTAPTASSHVSGSATGSSPLTSLTSVLPSSSILSSSVLSSSPSPSPTPTSTSHSSSTRSSSSPTSSIQTASSSTSSSSSATPSSSHDANSSGGEPTNVGAIVGGVCGGVAVLILGFGYALYSRTQRKKRNQKATFFDDDFNKVPVSAAASSPYQQGMDHPSPAMAAATYTSPYQQQQQGTYYATQDPYQPASPSVPNYGYSTPYQTHQDYYATPAPMASGGYHDAGHPGAYYPPAVDTQAYYDHPQQQQVYDYHYQQGYDAHYGNGSATNIAMPPPAPSPTTTAPTYSAPHSYDTPPAPPKKDR